MQRKCRLPLSRSKTVARVAADLRTSAIAVSIIALATVAEKDKVTNTVSTTLTTTTTKATKGRYAAATSVKRSE